jgi:hypothetical protein
VRCTSKDEWLQSSSKYPKVGHNRASLRECKALGVRARRSSSDITGGYPADIVCSTTVPATPHAFAVSGREHALYTAAHAARRLAARPLCPVNVWRTLRPRVSRSCEIRQGPTPCLTIRPVTPRSLCVQRGANRTHSRSEQRAFRVARR